MDKNTLLSGQRLTITLLNIRISQVAPTEPIDLI